MILVIAHGCAARSPTRLGSPDDSVVVVVLPRLLGTVVGRKPANPSQEGDDFRGFHLDEFPVGQERLSEGFPSLLTPRRTSPHEMFSVFFSFARFTRSFILQPNSLPVSFEKSAVSCLVARSFASAGVPVSKEPVGLLRSDGKRSLSSLGRAANLCAGMSL